MQVIEQFTQSKTGNDALNEDAIVVSSHFIAVIDGATARGGDTLKGLSNGRFAAQTLAAALPALPENITAQEAISHLTQALALAAESAAAEEGKAFRDPWAYPAAALLMYSKAHREVWRVADSSFMVDGGDPHYKTFPQEETWGQLRRAYLHAALLRGGTEEQFLEKDPSWDVISPIIGELKVFANNTGPYSYGVLNGRPVPAEHVEVFDVRTGQEFVFASDGYPEVFSTFSATETRLQEILRADPLMYKIYPQPKGMKKGYVSFDDRSYIRFKV